MKPSPWILLLAPAVAACSKTGSTNAADAPTTGGTMGLAGTYLISSSVGSNTCPLPAGSTQDFTVTVDATGAVTLSSCLPVASGGLGYCFAAPMDADVAGGFSANAGFARLAPVTECSLAYAYELLLPVSPTSVELQIASTSYATTTFSSCTIDDALSLCASIGPVCAYAATRIER